ncbi:MAG: hypothetical protein A3G34_04395 [Candidatus Lindowbacteria bacterium RIFCSPLOWO2_12_FULL_62_27]|nr:MAG: hypothetical protein A3G34_04395 [Candidatus Lindowbacteria bacterium RIFCSPLOWO2_12_FULL_62_27]OGH57984.1 MAG: hypothetical protein A3I06_06330 [Candidatus Lindowbacteria bacterium RIFCSPLOWO2_02_FULL_62_12]
MLTLAAYWPIRHHDFFDYDDNQYVTNNPQVRAGLTAPGIAWAFTTGHASNWHPLTWLSHMLDCQMFDAAAGGHHLVSLAIHIANAILLFMVLHRMTAAVWQAAFVAALFAVHPLTVESVAWVAERKNVLSTFFWFLAVGAYASYAHRPGAVRYAAVAASLALGLMAKPMLVSVPLVLLMLDYWPLKRFESATVAALVREKIPLMLIAAGSCVVTLMVQKSYAAAAIDHVPLSLRLANAFVSYVKYIVLMFWPKGLTFFYPHPGNALPVWQVIGSVLVLALVTGLAVTEARRWPYLTVGWLWYVVTLIPVIGIVQVGRQAMADRYTYVPLIGVYMAIAWGVSDATRAWARRGTILSAAAAAILIALLFGTQKYVAQWKDTRTLYEYSVRVEPDNYLAHYNLGNQSLTEGNLDLAIRHYSETVRCVPNHTKGRLGLGKALVQKGRIDEAIAQYQAALLIEPNYADAHSNLGSALARQGKLDDAVRHFARTLQIAPTHLNALNNMGAALLQQGRFEESIRYLTEALRLNPDFADARNNLERARWHLANRRPPAAPPL